MGNVQEVKKGRFLEIDALRGLAVLLMVFSHGLHWAHTGSAHDIVLILGTLSPGDIATPMFYFAAGLSLYFSLRMKLQKDPNSFGLRQRYTVRLGKLFIIGVMLSLSWGVLQAQAVTLLTLAWLTLTFPRLKKFSPPRYFFPALLLVGLGSHLFITSFTLPPVAQAIFAGQFPLMAIFTINIAGFYLAPRLQWHKFSLLAIGLGALLVGSALLLRSNAVILVRSGAPISFLLLGIGLGTLVLGVFHFTFIQRLNFFRYLTIVGKDALFIYIFHYVALFVPFYFSGFMGTMSATESLLFSTSVVMVVSITAKLRQKSKLTVFNMFDIGTATIWAYLSSLTLPSLTQRQSPTLENSANWSKR